MSGKRSLVELFLTQIVCLSNIFDFKYTYCGRRLLTFRNKLRDVATYFLLFPIFSVAMPLHVVTRISSLDRTTCKGRSI